MILQWTFVGEKGDDSAHSLFNSPKRKSVQVKVIASLGDGLDMDVCQ